MEKTEDLDLLELQELASNHKVSKRQKTFDEKRMIVKAHLLNYVPISQLCKEFGVSRMTIYKWISNFASGKVLSAGLSVLQMSNQIRQLCARRFRSQ